MTKLPYQIVTFVSLLAMTGCGVKKPTYPKAEEIRRSADGLYMRYLTNDIHGAKRDMEMATEILLSNTNHPSFDVSGALWLAYARLYVIEDTLGNTDRAKELFSTARSWYIEEQQRRRKYQKYSKERVRKNVESFTEQKCKDMVVEWDTAISKGTGAAYMKRP
jgi:hypothetical protein